MKRFTVLLTILAMFGFVTACDDDPKKEKVEICDNSIDDDGDTLIDCDDVDDCATATNCQVADEICDNDLDDDGDEATDCDDTDCADDPACLLGTRMLTVIGTSDLHSHLMGVGPARDYSPLELNEDGTKSGLARHAAIIGAIKAEKAEAGIPTILVDSGDSLMGDMVDLLSGDAPPVFHFFQLMGYDTVMLGNHDWDWTPAGTAVIINAAMEGVNFDRPLLCSNLVTDATDTRDDYIEAMVAGNIIQRYVLKPLDDDFTVGIFGMMGLEADINVPQAKPVTFWHEDPEAEGGYAQVQALVDEIRTAGADMVIHAGHAGINGNGIGEDRDTAANVTGIDLIMSGHRHQLLLTATKYLKVGDTYIIANGKYGENMTQMDLVFDLDEGAITDATGIVYNVDDLVLGDAQVAGVMDTYITMLDSMFLVPNLGITYSATPIAHTTFDLPSIDFYQDPLPLGADVEVPASLIVADAQYNALNAIVAGAVDAGLPLMDPTYDASPFAAAFIENGAVRDPLVVGQTGLIAAADAFKTFPLGIGPDGVPGYPMMSFYLTPREIKAIFDLDVEVRVGNAPLEYYMNPAGMRYIFDLSRGQFDKVVAVLVCNDAFTTKQCYANGTFIDVSDTTTNNMLRVSVDYYVSLLLAVARSEYEAIVIDPKLKDGTLVDMNSGAEIAALAFDAQPGDYDENTGAPIVQELKAWVALVMFIAGLEDNWDMYFGPGGNEPADGIPSVPARIYDKYTAPTGGDPNWQLGLDRGMDVVTYCAMVGNAAPFCP